MTITIKNVLRTPSCGHLLPPDAQLSLPFSWRVIWVPDLEGLARLISSGDRTLLPSPILRACF